MYDMAGLMKVKAQFSKRSLCDCGYGFLEDFIPIGTEYIVETDSIKNAVAICGGCGKQIRCHSIFAIGGFSKSQGTLPLEILELDEGILQ
jgi:hypothetical protein